MTKKISLKRSPPRWCYLALLLRLERITILRSTKVNFFHSISLNPKSEFDLQELQIFSRYFHVLYFIGYPSILQKYFQLSSALLRLWTLRPPFLSPCVLDFFGSCPPLLTLASFWRIYLATFSGVVDPMLSVRFPFSSGNLASEFPV